MTRESELMISVKIELRRIFNELWFFGKNTSNADAMNESQPHMYVS